MFRHNILEKIVSEISWRKQCGPKSPKWNKQETFGPVFPRSFRNFVSFSTPLLPYQYRKGRHMAILVQSKLAFLTDLFFHLHGQTVSDNHPLFLVFYFLKFKLYLDANARARSIQKNFIIIIFISSLFQKISSCMRYLFLYKNLNSKYSTYNFFICSQ